MVRRITPVVPLHVRLGLYTEIMTRHLFIPGQYKPCVKLVVDAAYAQYTVTSLNRKRMQGN
jgi:hypothetical protein